MSCQAPLDFFCFCSFTGSFVPEHILLEKRNKGQFPISLHYEYITTDLLCQILFLFFSVQETKHKLIS